MNNIKHIAYLFVLATLFGCADEEVINEKKGLQVTAGFAQTRTTFVEDNGTTRVNWEVGDEIGLFFNKPYVNCPLNVPFVAQNAGKSATFIAGGKELNAKEGDKIVAYHPYVPGDDFTGALLPDITEQKYKPNGSDYDFIYASGTVKDNRLSLQFKHAFAFLKLTVSKKLIDEIGENGGLYIESTEQIGYGSSSYNPETEEFKQFGKKNSLFYLLPTNEGMAGKDEVDCYIAILPQSEDAEISIHKANLHEEIYWGWSHLLTTKKAPAGGFQAGNVYTLYLEKEDIKSQRDALIALYNAAGGKNWKYQKNWCSDKPISEWQGVTLDNEGYVKWLIIGSGPFSGCIPPEISQLSHLTTLWMHTDHTIIEKPEDSALDAAETFKNLATLPELGGLDLASTYLNVDISTIDFSKFTNLSQLDLSGCCLYGTLPESMKQLTRLNNLGLAGNRFYDGTEYKGIKGEIASFFPYWSRMESFEVQGCLLSGPLPEWSAEQQKNMIRFMASSNIFTGSIPESHVSIFDNLVAIQNNPILEWNNYGYNVSGNALSGKIPEAMVRHPLFPLMMQNVMLQAFEPYVFDKIDIPWWSFTSQCDDGEVINFKELWRKNKYTIIWHLAEAEKAFDLDNMLMPKKYAKLKELYESKGLEVILSRGSIFCNNEDARWKEILSYMPGIREISIKEKEANPYYKVTDNLSVWDYNAWSACSDGSAFGDFYIIDSNGHLIYYGYGGGEGMKLSHGYPENSEDVFKFVANLFGDAEFPM